MTDEQAMGDCLGMGALEKEHAELTEELRKLYAENTQLKGQLESVTKGSFDASQVMAKENAWLREANTTANKLIESQANENDKLVSSLNAEIAKLKEQVADLEGYEVTVEHMEKFVPHTPGCHGIIEDFDYWVKCWKAQPANWLKDSSLETWFPFTAQELKALKRVAKAAEYLVANNHSERCIDGIGDLRDALSNLRISASAQNPPYTAEQVWPSKE